MRIREYALLRAFLCALSGRPREQALAEWKKVRRLLQHLPAAWILALLILPALIGTRVGMQECFSPKTCMQS
jgi:hypothetical protein